jgi:hypothetical protein
MLKDGWYNEGLPPSNINRQGQALQIDADEIDG